LQSAFLWGYASTQLLGGRLADSLGPRRVVAAGVVFFTLASFALPLCLPAAAAAAASAAAGTAAPASSFPYASAAARLAAGAATWPLAGALACRFFVGTGEGVCLPAVSALVATRAPRARRSSALGLAFSGFHAGNLLGLLATPALAAALVSRMNLMSGWRWVSFAWALSAIPALLLWLRLVPEERGGRGERRGGGEKESNGAATPGRSDAAPCVAALLSCPPVRAIVAANIVNHWGYFTLLHWMPLFFREGLGVSLQGSAALSCLPWAAMAAGSAASGALADALLEPVARGGRFGWSRTRVRRTLQGVAFAGPALLVSAVALVAARVGPGTSASASASLPAVWWASPGAATALLVTCLALQSLGQAGFVANMGDVAPRDAGALFGLANTFGSASGGLSAVAAGRLLELGLGFWPVFAAAAMVYASGCVLYLGFASGERHF